VWIKVRNLASIAVQREWSELGIEEAVRAGDDAAQRRNHGARTTIARSATRLHRART
jgi:hypothetical protein